MGSAKRIKNGGQKTMADDDEIKRGDSVTDGRNIYTVMAISGEAVQLQGQVGVLTLSLGQLRKVLPPPAAHS